MTDYKIQMKRFNGTDYDNLFPIPHGYGLGETEGKTISSLAEITAFGFYRLPTGLGITPDDASNWGAIFVGPNINYGNLIACRGGYVAVMSRTAGVFGPWEWLNPALTVGVEYRTTERYNGKPVYAMLFDFGGIPLGTWKHVNHSIANVDKMFEVSGVCSNNQPIPSTSFNTGFWDAEVSLSADRNLIQIVTRCSAGSEHLLQDVTAVVKLRYTKTTD